MMNTSKSKPLVKTAIKASCSVLVLVPFCSFSSSETTTTDNVLCDGCEYQKSQQGNVDVGNRFSIYGVGGGQEVYRVEVDQIMTEAQIQAGFDVSAQVTALTCLNTIGSNQSCNDIGDPTPDPLALNLSVSDGVLSFDSQREFILDNGPMDGFQDFSISLTVPENQLSMDSTFAALSIFGDDAGFWRGNFGPAVTDPTMQFSYAELKATVLDPVSTATDQVIDLNQTSPITQPTITTQPQSEVASITPSLEPPAEPDADAATESTDETDGGSDDEPMQAPPNLAGGVSQVVGIAALASASADVSAYTRASLPDAQFYEPRSLDGGTNWDSPYARKWTVGSDRRMEALVDMQWVGQ